MACSHCIRSTFQGILDEEDKTNTICLALYSITGGEYDLIGWDPRGTADTLTFSVGYSNNAFSLCLPPFHSRLNGVVLPAKPMT